jgi:hypothetical protein
MTELAQAHQVQKVLAETKGFEAELTRYAVGTMAYRHTKDRLDSARRDLERAKTGRWCGPNT